MSSATSSNPVTSIKPIVTVAILFFLYPFTIWCFDVLDKIYCKYNTKITTMKIIMTVFNIILANQIRLVHKIVIRFLYLSKQAYFVHFDRFPSLVLFLFFFFFDLPFFKFRFYSITYWFRSWRNWPWRIITPLWNFV